MTVFYLRQVQGSSPQSASSQKSTRVGFTVGKALGGAVVRNRIKRRLREAVRQKRAILISMGGLDGMDVDIVINPKKSILTLEFAAVLDEVGRAFETIARKLVTK
jgi:ribonuclease P protein component